jgi:hypothetical protein
MPSLLASLLVSLLVFSGSAHAVTVKEYEQSKNNENLWPMTTIYLDGVGVGASLSASALLQQGRPALFCKPKEIELKRDDYIRLVDAFIAKNEVGDAPIESILLLALATAFPCS